MKAWRVISPLYKLAEDIIKKETGRIMMRAVSLPSEANLYKGLPKEAYCGRLRPL